MTHDLKKREERNYLYYVAFRLLSLPVSVDISIFSLAQNDQHTVYLRRQTESLINFQLKISENVK